MLGRAFTQADDNSEARVVIFTYEAWQRYFNGDPNILGRQVRLALTPYTVIGILPRGFQFPIGVRSEYLTPIRPLVASALKSRGSHFLRILGRLQPGVTIEAARAEAMAIAARLAQQYPDTNTDRSAKVVSFHHDLTGELGEEAVAATGHRAPVDQSKGEDIRGIGNDEGLRDRNLRERVLDLRGEPLSARSRHWNERRTRNGGGGRRVERGVDVAAPLGAGARAVALAHRVGAGAGSARDSAPRGLRRTLRGAPVRVDVLLTHPRFSCDITA